MGLMSISRAEWQAWCRQIKEHGTIRLFKSCNPIYQDDEQLRDFEYVKDACRVILWLLKNPEVSGLFNVGTGRAQSFRELAEAVFHALLRCRTFAGKVSVFYESRDGQAARCRLRNPFYGCGKGRGGLCTELFT